MAEARNKGGVGTAENEVVIRRDAGERARAGTVAGIKTGTEAGVVRTKPRGLSRTGGVPGWLSAVAAALMAALCALSTSLPAWAHDLPDDAAEFAAEFAARRDAEAASAPRRPDLSRAARAPEGSDGEKKEADHDNG